MAKIAWATWALAGLALEAWALHHAGGGDTLTDQVRAILSHPWAWWAGAGITTWTAGHFFFGWQ